MNNLDKAKDNFLRYDKGLSEYASKDSDSIRLEKEKEILICTYKRNNFICIDFRTFVI